MLTHHRQHFLVPGFLVFQRHFANPLGTGVGVCLAPPAVLALTGTDTGIDIGLIHHVGIDQHAPTNGIGDGFVGAAGLCLRLVEQDSWRNSRRRQRRCVA